MAQGARTSISELLGSLTKSLLSSLEITPRLSGIEPSTYNPALLDVKNELLLAYLQNLVFLILIKIRNGRENLSSSSRQPSGVDVSDELSDAVVKKLVELRLYLEKGVRPLEDKARYSIEKLLRALDDAERQRDAEEAAKLAREKQRNGAVRSGSESGSDSEDGDSTSGGSGDEDVPAVGSIPESQHRAAGFAFVRPAGADAAAAAGGKDGSGSGSGRDGIYRPPRVRATVMPTTERRRDKGEQRRPVKSATMDEFIHDELSATPAAQPSIGTNIQARGRHVRTAAERREAAERQAFEETHFVRLPKEGKKEKARKDKAAGRTGRMSFGGEEWRDLGEGADRINKLTSRKGGGGGGGGNSTRALLEKSRKRGIETVDGPRGSGSAAGAGGPGMGERYMKRLKVQELGRTSRGRKK